MTLGMAFVCSKTLEPGCAAWFGKIKAKVNSNNIDWPREVARRRSESQIESARGTEQGVELTFDS